MKYIIEPVLNGYALTIIETNYFEDGSPRLARRVFQEKEILRIWNDQEGNFKNKIIKDENTQQQYTLEELFHYIASEECCNNIYYETELRIDVVDI